MAFSDPQQRLLTAKLDGRHVRARQKNGATLLYIEGWHAIAEANRVFGFDGWDRETLAVECIAQNASGGTFFCSYRGRVRIRVRAGETSILRDGTGFGFGQAANAADAHELAIKDAETDATKRALVTFGNLFGLALYDRARHAVKNKHLIEGLREREWTLRNRAGETIAVCPDPQAFCAALRRIIQATSEAGEAEGVWRANHAALMQLSQLAELRTPSGVHYADLLERVYASHVGQLRSAEGEPSATEQIANGEPLQGVRARRVRDEEHLRYVANQPCLVCGRRPTQAHHLRFAQPRAMGKKVSDEWTVPLCLLHHRALHDAGNEEKWWAKHVIDAVEQAQRLWRQTHAADSPRSSGDVDRVVDSASESDERVAIQQAD